MSEQKNTADVIIVGGGPAGLSAALWCAELRMKTILFEKEAYFGGQLLRIYNPITNYIGLETKNGREMRDRFMSAVEKIDNNDGFIIRLQAEAANIDTAGKKVILDNGEHFSANAMIIATGVRRRKLGVDGEDAFQGKGIIESGAKEKEKVENRIVAIVGGGDAALENALILSDYAKKIYVIHRRADLSARSEFLDVAKKNVKIEFRPNTTVRKFTGIGKLNAVEVANIETGRKGKIGVDFALIRIGVEPNTELLGVELGLDDNRYLPVNNCCETGAEGVFAIGDVANPVAPTISGAAGMGAIAAKAIYLRKNLENPV